MEMNLPQPPSRCSNSGLGVAQTSANAGSGCMQTRYPPGVMAAFALAVILFTQNLLWTLGLSTWTLVSLLPWALTGVGLMVVARRGTLSWPQGSGLLALAVGVLALPLQWLHQVPAWDPVARSGGLALLALLLTQAGASPGFGGVARRTGWLCAGLTLMCALIVVVQALVLPYWPVLQIAPLLGRPSGPFLQINVMASFLATGLALVLWLYYSAPAARWPAVAALSLLAFSLVFCQSTIGYLGAGIVLVCLSSLAWRDCRGRVLAAWAGIIWGAGLARSLNLLLGVHILDHEAGRFSRLQVWEACLWLIRQKPFFGWGYGRFDAVLPEAFRALGMNQMEQKLFPHPHNEILYWLVEGGLVAGLGLALLLAWYLRLGLWAWQQARQAGDAGMSGRAALGWFVCTFPILAHTQVEYPLYQSSLHCLLLAVLLALSLSALKAPVRSWQPRGPVRGIFRVLTGLAGVAGVIFIVLSTWMTVLVRNVAVAPGQDVDMLVRLQHLNPWFAPDAVGYALAVHQITQFNQTGDTGLLPAPSQFLAGYVSRHPDRGAYVTWLATLSVLGETQRYRQALAEARWRVSWASADFGGTGNLPASPSQPVQGTGENK